MTDPLDLEQRKTVRVVDDTPDNLSLMAGLRKTITASSSPTTAKRHWPRCAADARPTS
jgi:hypothetical protein